MPQAAQPVQQAAQQAVQSPISSDPPAVIADEAVGENADYVNPSADGTLDTDGKDPQQAALDQAATTNNNIDPTGSEAVVDDEDDDGKKLNSNLVITKIHLVLNR